MKERIPRRAAAELNEFRSSTRNSHKDYPIREVLDIAAHGRLSQGRQAAD